MDLFILKTWIEAKFNKDETGASMVEYGLLLALIAIIIIVALIFLGPIISQLFQNVGTTLNNV